MRDAQRRDAWPGNEFRRIAEQAPWPIWVANPQADLVFVNRAWLAFRGSSVDEALGSGWIEGVHPADRSRCLEVLRISFEKRQSFEIEYRLRRHDAVNRWMLDRGAPLFENGVFRGFVGSCIDLTERRRLEDISEQIQRLARIGGWELDLEKDELYWTDQTHRIHGTRASTFTPGVESAMDLYPPEDRARLGALAEGAMSGSGAWEDEFQIVRRDVPDEAAWYCIARDVTEQRRLAEEQRQLEEAMRNAQRLEGLGLLAGGIAHDFKNFLTSILAHADILGARLADEPKLRRSTDLIRTTVRQAASLCDQLLTYAGRGQRTTEALDLSAMTREMAELLGASVGRRVRLELDCADGLPSVDADASQLRQVILNLITNAAESLPAGEEGLVVLTTSACRLDDADRERFLLAPSASAQQWVRLEVRDTGSGLTASDRDRIFEPFFTTKSTGRGLGLAVVRGIIAGHGGGLAVDSVAGCGTRFEILLPAGGAQVEAEAASMDESLRAEGTVLVVDDDPEVRRAATILLEHLGFDVRGAERGEKAIELVDTGEEFRIVLLDLTMPGLGGEATLRALRARRPDLPVVLISGFSRKELDLTSFGEPEVYFLSKPFDAEQLLRAFRRALAPPVCEPVRRGSMHRRQRRGQGRGHDGALVAQC